MVKLHSPQRVVILSAFAVLVVAVTAVNVLGARRPALLAGTSCGIGQGQACTGDADCLVYGAGCTCNALVCGAGASSSSVESSSSSSGGCTPPSAPGVPDLAQANDTGVFDTDNVTKETLLGFTVTCSSTYSVKLYNGISLLATAACSGGSVNFAVSLSEGTNSINATQTDVTCESTASADLSVTVDTTAPHVSSLTPTDGATGVGLTDSLIMSFDETVYTDTGELTVEHGVTVDQTIEGATATGLPSSTATFDPNDFAAGTDYFILASNVVRDLAGNGLTGWNTNTDWNFTTVDSAPSAPGTPDLVSGSDLGTSSTDNITNDNTPSFTVTCDSTNTVQLYVDGVSSGSSGACSGGTVTLTTGTISDGTVTVTAKQTNGGGTSSASSGLSVTIDTVAPSAPTGLDLSAGSDSGTSSTDNITNDNTPTITGSATTGVTVTLYNGVTSVGTTTASAGAFSITASTIADSNASFTATATDTAGNVSSNSSALAVTVDTTSPSAPSAPNLQAGSDSGTSSTDDITNDTTPTFDIDGTETNAVVALKIDGTTTASATAVSSTTSISAAAISPDGAYSFTAIQTDVAGNVSSASSGLSVTIDTTAPSAPGAPNLATASDSGDSGTDDITNVAAGTYTMTCPASSTVTLYDTDGSTSVGTGSCSGGSVTITSSSLSEATHTLTAKATDTAGNTSAASSSLSVTILTTSPGAPGDPSVTAATDTGSSNSDGITNTDPVFTGTCTTGKTVKIYNAGTSALIGSTTCSASEYSVTSSGLSGTVSVNAKQFDVAGNSSGTSNSISVTIDTTAPSAPSGLDLTAASDTGTSNIDNFTSDTTPTIDIVCETAAIVYLYESSTQLGSGTCVAGGVSITSSGIGEGAHSLTAMQTDVAGNDSSTSSALSITISTAVCGDGTQGVGEECDNGTNNGVSGGDCSLLCARRYCGNGTTEADRGEQCDDANNVDGDGCNSCVVKSKGGGGGGGDGSDGSSSPKSSSPKSSSDGTSSSDGCYWAPVPATPSPSGAGSILNAIKNIAISLLGGTPTSQSSSSVYVCPTSAMVTCCNTLQSIVYNPNPMPARQCGKLAGAIGLPPGSNCGFKKVYAVEDTDGDGKDDCRRSIFCDTTSGSDECKQLNGTSVKEDDDLDFKTTLSLEDSALPVCSW